MCKLARESRRDAIRIDALSMYVLPTYRELIWNIRREIWWLCEFVITYGGCPVPCGESGREGKGVAWIRKKERKRSREETEKSIL